MTNNQEHNTDNDQNTSNSDQHTEASLDQKVQTASGGAPC